MSFNRTEILGDYVLKRRFVRRQHKITISYFYDLIIAFLDNEKRIYLLLSENYVAPVPKLISSNFFTIKFTYISGVVMGGNLKNNNLIKSYINFSFLSKFATLNIFDFCFSPYNRILLKYSSINITLKSKLQFHLSNLKKLDYVFLIHKDLHQKKNLIEAPNSEIYFIDFEKAILTRKWFLFDIVNMTFVLNNSEVQYERSLMNGFLYQIKNRIIVDNALIVSQIWILLLRKYLVNTYSNKMLHDLLTVGNKEFSNYLDLN